MEFMVEGRKGKPLRVLVVDDSAYNRQTISSMLQSHSEITVIGRASDGEAALGEAARLEPDVITLDLEMPKMDGFTFLRILMTHNPTPVIVISSHSNRNNVFKALELGALDFISKPTKKFSPELVNIKAELIQKVLMVRQLSPTRSKPKPVASDNTEAVAKAQAKPNFKTLSTSNLGLVVVGASTGGPPALQTFFSNVNTNLPLAYLVAQHMPASFTKTFAQRLNKYLGLRVREARGGELIGPCEVYIAPGGADLAVVDRGSELMTEIRPAKTDAKYVPSIDVLLNSASKLENKKVAAILMTGMGDDGCIGMQSIKSAGGLTMAESEETAVIFGMPREAIESGCVDMVLRLEHFAFEVERFADRIRL